MGTKNVVNDQSGAKSSAQTKKEHPTASITAQRLHSRVIDYLYSQVKRPFENTEPQPILSQDGEVRAMGQPWITERDSQLRRRHISNRPWRLAPQ